MVLFLTDPSGMHKDKEKMAERILNLTLEIIYLLIGEDYTVVKKTSHVSGEWSRTRSPMNEPLPPLVICESSNELKILELTNKIIELLTGESEDVTKVKVEAVQEETHVRSDQPCKEEQAPIDISPVEPRHRNSPERRLLYSPDYTRSNCSESQAYQDEERAAVKVEAIGEESYVRCGQLWTEEEGAVGGGSADDRPRNPEGRIILFPDYKTEDPDIIQDKYEDNRTAPIISTVLQSREPWEMVRPPSEEHSQCGKCLTQNIAAYEHRRDQTDEKLFSCPECGKYFSRKHHLERHQRIHTGEKPFLCSQCGKYFSRKHHLETHQRIHTGEKPYSCLECGKCFAQTSVLNEHKKVHSDDFTKDLKRHLLSPHYGIEAHIGRDKPGKPPINPNISLFFQSRETPSVHCDRRKPSFDQNVGLSRAKIFPCSECGKLFKHNSSLSIHKRTHSNERPYACSECGKGFTQKSVLVEHQRIHTGEKPFSCLECGRCFAQKSALAKHERTHTGEKPYPCLECGKCFTQKSSLVKHQRIHTGHKPYSCLECGKCFTHKSDIMRHEKTHIGEKPLLCQECGKYFAHKSDFVTHQRIHKGERPFSCYEYENFDSEIRSS
ncbi:zinc finger protein ZFP2-like isoform X1 [Eleutherodactylus coqui]|uniref:zinc finger protein ZFP2-like isoform X1 n=1 Tax=Eleutherodactylus coqui TaxID=57060 RepID=UPI0034623179